MLLDWGLRTQLISTPAAAELAGTSDAVGEWLAELRASPPSEVTRRLWVAATSDRTSSWGQLYTLLDPHLMAIRKEMFRTIDSLAGDERYAAIVKGIIRRWPGSVTKTPSSVVWLLAVSQATLGKVPPTIYPLAAASAFYYQGVVIFDDIADGELQPVCAGWPRGQVEHLAYSMAAALPLAAVERLHCPPEIRLRVLHELTQAIWITNIGQFADLEVLGPANLSEAEAVTIAQQKTGLGIAKLTRMACHCLLLDASTTERWGQATLAFATARQVASDVCDLWVKAFSPDIATGKCTLPIAYALRSLKGSALERFQALRARCRYEPLLHAELLEQLEQLDSLSYVQRHLEQWRARGVELLDELNVPEPARRWILTWATQADIFGDVC
jgi:hypothetical protein